MNEEYEEGSEPLDDELDEPQESPDSEVDASEPEGEEEVTQADLQDLRSQMEARLRESARRDRQHEEERRLSQERERALLQAIQTRDVQRVDPMQEARAALAERGIPEDAAPVILDLIQRQSREVAAGEVTRLIEPMLKTWEAQQRLEQELGDYPRREVLGYLNQNPDVQARYERMNQSDPTGAHEYALLKYREATGTRAEQRLEDDNREVSRMKKEGRTTGRVLSPRGSRERRQGREESAEVIQERLQKLRDEAVLTKDPTRFIAERMKLIPSFSRVKWADPDE